MTINAAIDDQTAGDNPRVLTCWRILARSGSQRQCFEQIDIAAIQFGVEVAQLIHNVAVPTPAQGDCVRDVVSVKFVLKVFICCLLSLG